MRRPWGDAANGEAMKRQRERVRMKVDQVVVDPATRLPLLTLRAVDHGVSLELAIGVFEASAIAVELERIAFERPMTHDLFARALEVMGATITSVEITDVRDRLYLAVIELDRGGQRVRLDCRPSDAIALALRAKAPIHVARHVIDHALEKSS
jgi:bifunctional DNase/RNase